MLLKLGSIFAESTKKVKVGDTVVSSWQQWSKKLSNTSAAVLLVNNADETQRIPLDLSLVPTFSGMSPDRYYAGRDVYNHYNMGTQPTTATYFIGSHDSAFMIFSC